MTKIDKICKETIIQGIENIKYRLEKNKNKKIKIITNEDFYILLLNTYLIREEIQKINDVGKYIITNEEQYKRYIERKRILDDKRRNDNRIL